MKTQLLLVLIIVLAAVPHAVLAADHAPIQRSARPTQWACNDTSIVKEADSYRIGLSHSQIGTLLATGSAVGAVLSLKVVKAIRPWMLIVLFVSAPFARQLLDRERNECGIYIYVTPPKTWPPTHLIWSEPQAP